MRNDPVGSDERLELDGVLALVLIVKRALLDTTAWAAALAYCAVDERPNSPDLASSCSHSFAKLL